MAPNPSPMSHSNPTGPGCATDKDARSLLSRYQCPTPFHVVRSLFMGNIASPRLDVSPLEALAQIWGGEMPVFASQENVEEVTRTLVQGLWNRLADHQNSRNPFRLTRFEVLPTRQALHDLALLRTQELEGFVDGLFGHEDEMMLPQKAHDAVRTLDELYSMFGGTAELLADQMAMSRSSLFRQLKRLTGLSPLQYVDEARFQKARMLLETRAVSSVKAAAYAVGLKQVKNFSQNYTKRFGKQPSEQN